MSDRAGILDFVDALLGAAYATIPDWCEWKIDITPAVIGTYAQTGSVSLHCRVEKRIAKWEVSTIHIERAHGMYAQLADDTVAHCRTELGL